MRKGVLYFIVILFLLYSFKTYASPAYGTKMPGKNKVTTGYQNNIIFKHDLSNSYGNVRTVQNFYELSFGVYDWFSVDGKVGMGNLRTKGGVHPTVQHNYGFAGGYGVRFRFLNDIKNKVRVVGGFQHISIHPPSKNVNGDKREAIYEDWQASLLSSKDIGIFTPYAGAKFSYGNLIQRTNNIDRKNRPPLYYGGVIVGCHVNISKDVYVTVESHFIDETSLCSGIYYTF